MSPLRNRAVASLGAVLAAVAIVGASSAKAEPDPSYTPDEQRFLANTSGIVDVSTIWIARDVCRQLSAGKTRQDMEVIVFNELHNVKPDAARAFVDFAVDNMCPNAPHKSTARDQASAEAVVKERYARKQKGCTPDRPSQFQSITWDPPGFSPDTGGIGVVHDATQGLGGQFRETWGPDGWEVEFMFC